MASSRTREFVIPLDKDDLMVVRDNAYTVNMVEPPGSLTKAIDATRAQLQSDGPEFIAKSFDTFFSVLVHGPKVDVKITLRALDRVHKATDQLIEQMELLFENRADLNTEEKLKYRNMNKMYAYLLSSLASSIEDYVVKNSNDTANIGKRKKVTQKSDIMEEWEPRRQKILEMMYRWFQLPLHKLWTPPSVEDLFISKLVQFCYKVLEQSRDAKAKSVRETIFEILGTLVKRYNQGISCVVRIIQLVQLYDALAIPLAAGVIHMVEETGCTSFITAIIHELGRNEPGETEARNTATFLEAVASAKPQFVLPIIDDITEHLGSECYAMRNCVIGVLGAVVAGSLTDQDMTDEKRRLRDECLNHLLEHILDVSAYVRSKVLQVWQRLCCDGAVPVRLQVSLIKAVTERLHDKAAQVRKQALQLLRTLVQCNPFAAKLDREDFAKQLEEGRAKLKELQVLVVSLSTCGDVDRLELWNSLLPEIRRAIADELSKKLNEDSSSEDEDEEPVSDRRKVSGDVEFETIRHSLLTGDVTEAVEHLLSIFQSLPDAPDMYRMKQADKETCLLVCLQKIFEESEAHPPPTGATGKPSENAGATNGKTDKDHAARMRELKKYKEDLAAKRNLVHYIENCLDFAKELEGTIPLAESLMFVTTPSVAIEACTFLGTAAQFGVPSAVNGVRKALLQVTSQDPSVRNNVASVYKDIYLGTTDANQSTRQRALASVKGLVELLQGMNEDGQSRALSQLVGTWRANKDLGPEELQVMWEKFSMKIPNTTPIESRAALVLLTMAADAEPTLLTGNLQVLIKVGLGARARDDLLLARDTCRALQKIRHVPDDPLKPPLRYPNDHVMFEEIVTLLTESFTNNKEAAYLSFAIDALNAIYRLADSPSVLAKKVLCTVLKKSNLMKQVAMTEEMVQATQQQRSQRSQSRSASVTQQSSDASFQVITRLLHLAGHTAIRELVHLDSAVYKELKRRNTLREMKKGNKTLQGPVSTPASAQRTLRNKEASNTTLLEDETTEEVLVGATADDADADLITNALESDIVTGSGFLAQFVPLVLDVCRNPERYNDQTVQASAVLALSKMMTVSSSFCVQHLQLLVTIMERSPYPSNRANVVIALSDLSSRFPNKIEPWTSHLYGRLRDDNVLVRRTCVNVLANLIMREMIRAKGKVSSLALCIIDADEVIRESTKQFFKDLSQKGNALYNVMPDILSHLMDPELNLEEKDFQEIIKYVLGLQQKERQTDTIIDKLCSRLKLATMERQWRDISYCLSLLSFSVKSIRNLMECLPQLKAKIHNKHVLKSLQTIIETTKKKPEAKAACIELEQKMEKLLENPEAGEDNIDQDDRVAMPPPPVPKDKKKMRRAPQPNSSSDEDTDDDDEDSDVERAAATPKSAKKPPKSSVKRNKPEESSPSSSTPARAKRNRQLKPETPRRSTRSKKRL